MFNIKFVYGTKQYIKIGQKINRTFVDSQYFFRSLQNYSTANISAKFILVHLLL